MLKLFCFLIQNTNLHLRKPNCLHLNKQQKSVIYIGKISTPVAVIFTKSLKNPIEIVKSNNWFVLATQLTNSVHPNQFNY